MKRGLYFKLAFTNVRKNKNSFFPFLISVIAMTSMFYMLKSIAGQDWDTFYGAEQVRVVLGFGVGVVGIVSAIIILYTNSFVMKQRNQELGLYNVLGMEKKHIAKVLSWEIVIVAVIGMGIGLIGGIAFSKLLFLILIRMIGLEPKFHFQVPLEAVWQTIAGFLAIFAGVIVLNLLRILRLKPVELMRETHAGEREPKAKWLLALLGIAALSIAYYTALTKENPLEAMNYFFLAVILVIIGTYLLFIAGSIVFLKLLKKNKNFYYHKTHFVTISGMLYRMKQNAAGLASICILVTMVIVTFATTVSLYLGVEDEVRYRYPKDINITLPVSDKSQKEWKTLLGKVEAETQKCAEKNKLTIKGLEAYCQSEVYLVKTGKASFRTGTTNRVLSDRVVLKIMMTSEYNHLTGQNKKATGEKPLLLTSDGVEVYGDAIKVDKNEIPVEKAGKVEKKQQNGLTETMYMLVDSYDALRDMTNRLIPKEERKNNDIKQFYNFNLTGERKQEEAYANKIQNRFLKAIPEQDVYLEDYYSGWKDAIGIYASVLFIGIFIGALFLVATVLIIYYKQISEGYEDRKNFQIMSKIGLANQEIGHIINSQICTVFLLPIAVAVVHICFAYPMIEKIMALMNLTNEKLFVGCVIGTVVVFVAIYMLIYKITSKVYYKIVRR